jgi:hypothetical protein
MKSALYELLLSIQRHFSALSAGHYFYDLAEETIKEISALWNRTLQAIM